MVFQEDGFDKIFHLGYLWEINTIISKGNAYKKYNFCNSLDFVSSFSDKEAIYEFENLIHLSLQVAKGRTKVLCMHNICSNDATDCKEKNSDLCKEQR